MYNSFDSIIKLYFESSGRSIEAVARDNPITTPILAVWGNNNSAIMTK